MIKFGKGSLASTYDDVEDLVCRELDGDDYGMGSLEANEQTVKNLCNAFARMLDVTNVPLNTIAYIVKGYAADITEEENDNE